MERTSRGFASTSPLRGRPDQAGTASRRPRRDDRLDPASRATNRALRGAEYGRFAAELRRDLDPRGPLEDLVARQAIRSAWRLKVDLEGAPDAVGPEGLIVADRAARSLEVAITTLDLLQNRRAEVPTPEVPAASDPFAWADAGEDERPEPESNEWPVLPLGPADCAPRAAKPVDGEAPIWRDRLVYDFDVSDMSPVIKGTWITVSHVVSLIVDGATWADILRTHPELTEADIRVCVAYAVADDSSAL